MASFSSAIQEKILELEGGYQNNSMDTGNYNSRNQLIGTNFGISAPILEAWLGRVPSVSDMKSLSKSEAMRIYKKLFWDRNRFDDFSNQALASIVFDATIQHGPGSRGKTGGVTMLQTLLNTKFGEKLAVDGQMGSLTLAAVDRNHPGVLHNLYKDRRAEYYNDIALAKPQQSGFLQGWLNRLDQFPDQPEDGSISPVRNSRLIYFLGSFKHLLHSPAARREGGIFLLVIVAIIFAVVGYGLQNNRR